GVVDDEDVGVRYDTPDPLDQARQVLVLVVGRDDDEKLAGRPHRGLSPETAGSGWSERGSESGAGGAPVAEALRRRPSTSAVTSAPAPRSASPRSSQAPSRTPQVTPSASRTSWTSTCRSRLCVRCSTS